MAPQKCLALEQKVALIRSVEKGEKPKYVIAKEFNIPAATLSTIMKNKQDVFDGFKKTFSSKRKRDQGSKYPEVNDWLDCFKKWHAVRSTPASGESGAMNQDTVDTWRQNRLAELLGVYPERDIYNLDEAALFCKLLPKGTYTTADGSSSGVKQSKECFTVLFGANATGDEKLPLLILDKAEKPHCFHGAALPKDCVYRGNKHAWMTAAIFQDYVWLLDRKFPARQWKVFGKGC
ncbi:tigger transposable element-derived protein 4-like [Ornithodoros turicata]|uniref:tigger transposable element-derived protein 4-like n=1 Tax=Ornithodoros turicata TaxID=34597 RepID=UPI00313A3AC5